MKVETMIIRRAGAWLALLLLSACFYETPADVIGPAEGVRVESVSDGHYLPADDIYPSLDLAWDGAERAYSVTETLQNGETAAYMVRIAPLANGFYLLQTEQEDEPIRLFIARASKSGFTLFEVANTEAETWIAVQNDAILSPHRAAHAPKADSMTESSEENDDTPPQLSGPPANIRKFLAALASSAAIKPAVEYRRAD
ncbi:MAG: hypothetical protein WCF16_08025 [Alphaproteobacteria bacterium]